MENAHMNRFIMILTAFAMLCMPALGQTTTIFNSWNGDSVDNNPTSSASFTISEPHLITYIDTYHYNSGQGASAGGTISLKRDDGEIFGPWTVRAESSSGAANAWWKCLPYVVIPAGTYTIIDSEPETWSKNPTSNGCGFSKIEGIPGYSVSEPNIAQEEAAEVSPDSGKETEAALTSDVALGNKENPIIIPLTPTQKDFLNLVVDDLRKIGNKKTAENLEKYIAGNHVHFSDENPGNPAWVDPNKILGAIPVVSNELTIQQQEVNNWGKSKDMASIRSMAFTLIHEDVHMGQYLPDQVPEYENEAYETQISEERRVINEDMQKIREIQGRGANLPGDQDKLNELIEDLKVSRDVYVENTQAFEPEVIAKGYVDPERFKTTVSDMKTLAEEAGDLIKSVGQSADPNTAQAWWNKGVAFYYQGKYDDAITAYEEAIRLDPNYATAWYYKALAFKALGRTADADAAYAKAKELDYDTYGDVPLGA
jgi:tetratricopeptide (TPR) repeat protein